MGVHVFVAMPYGRQQGIDFDAVYADLLKPALEDAGGDVFRANEVQRVGQVHSELFSALLRADLVLVDQTSRNADVWYQLDVLRAFRARGVVRVQGQRSERVPAPDVDHPLTYHLKDGQADPRFLPADRQIITERARMILNGFVPHAESDVAKTQRPARRVVLFSGHMIDAAERRAARFPASQEGLAGAAIAARLDQLAIDENDLAICGGACGGDLLFAEAALQRGAWLDLYLQYGEADFLRASVAFAGASWVDRYRAVKANPRTRTYLQPEALGPLPEGIDPYVRNNLWQLFSALAHGVGRLHFVALWDGKGGSGPGGTQNMVDTVRRFAGQVSIIDSERLFGLGNEETGEKS